MNNVSFLPSDAKTAEERLTGQNASLRSIQNDEVTNIRELEVETSRQEANLAKLLDIYVRVQNSIKNLTKAVDLLTDLEWNLMVGTKQGGKVTAIMADWKAKHGDTFDFKRTEQ